MIKEQRRLDITLTDGEDTMIERTLPEGLRKSQYFVRIPDVDLKIVSYAGARKEAVTEASSAIDAVGHVVARTVYPEQIGIVLHALDRFSKRGRAEYACLIPEVEDEDSNGMKIPTEDLRWLRELAFAETLALYAGKGRHPNYYVKEARRIFDTFRIC